MDSGSNPVVLSAEALPIFGEGISLILSRWTALQAAVENEWGGRDSRRKAELISSDILAWFTQSRRNEPLYIDDLESILDEGMLSLNTMTEDGSTEEVAEKIMIMHEECLGGNYQTIEKLRSSNARGTSQANVVKVANENGDEDEDDSDEEDDDDETTCMMVDSPTHQSNSNRVTIPNNASEPPKQVPQAEDGWEVVSSRRNKGKKN